MGEFVNSRSADPSSDRGDQFIAISKSRIKRLRGLSQPQYRLRVDDIRVFYDVTETQVQVLAIVAKAEAQAWLDEQGTPAKDPAEGGGPGRSER